jgi:pimeloyl-ACP methyl ester carboxylesterase
MLLASMGTDGSVRASTSGALTSSRRAFLGLSSALSAAPYEPNEAANATERSGATYVLVHGAWHSSYHWYLLAERLRAAGERVIAIDLPGHGVNARYPESYFASGQRRLDTEPSPLRDVALDWAASSVVVALRLAQGLVKPVLVGHSLGGTVITRAAELAPELIGRLVYLSAFLPTRVHSPAALSDLPEAHNDREIPITVGDPVRIGAIRINPRGDLGYLRKLHSVFYQDVAFERFLPFAMALSPDLPWLLWAGENRVTQSRWGSLPRTYIRCTEDRAISPDLQSKMIADADDFAPKNRFQVLSLKSSHSPFVSSVAELSSMLQAVGGVST